MPPTKTATPPALADLDAEGLASRLAEMREEFESLASEDAPTDEQVERAEALAVDMDAVIAEQGARESAATERAERMAGLRERFQADQAEGEEGEGDEPAAEGGEGAEGEGDAAAGDEPAAEEGAEGAEGEGGGEAQAAAAAATARPTGTTANAQRTVRTNSTVAALAAKRGKPAPAAFQRKPVGLIASSGVEGFNTGQRLTGLDQVAQAFESRLAGYPEPAGDGNGGNWVRNGVVSFKPEFENDLIIKPGQDAQEILERARKEARLPGGSLQAAGGWCAPSETIYDLCTTETLDGILSVPEVQIHRGGIKFTSGPDFSAVYAAASGFDLTEAQAIAGTPAKAPYEITCPSFTEIRLDAVGFWLKAPILTYAGYPELIQRFISGTLIAHAHRVNAKVIGKMVTAAGAARVFTAATGVLGDTLDSLELVAETLREKYAMGIAETMEVVLPTWVLGALRADMSHRTGRDEADPVTDQALHDEFNARHLNVTFVRDWQMLTTPDTRITYPATVQALMYPAGTFVKGVSDVLNLSTMYDSAQLPTNVYTAAFVEQGVLVAQMCNQAALVTITVAYTGKTGAASL